MSYSGYYAVNSISEYIMNPVRSANRFSHFSHNSANTITDVYIRNIEWCTYIASEWMYILRHFAEHFTQRYR